MRRSSENGDPNCRKSLDRLPRMTSIEDAPYTDPAPSEALTLAQLAEMAGVSVATVSKVVNGRSEVGSETRALVEGLIQAHGFRRQRRRIRPAGLIEVVFHELAGDYPIEIVKGRPVGGQAPPPQRRGLRAGRTPRPRLPLDRGCAQPPPRRSHHGVLRPDGGAAHPAGHARGPADRARPGGRPGPGRAVGRGHQLERRPGGHPPPARTRPPPDRHDHRPGVRPVRPGPPRRLPRRPRRAPGSGSIPS